MTDFNLDGLIDLVVVNRGQRAQLWRNVSQDSGRWIQVKLQQPGPNRDTIGAWIEMRRGEQVMRREISVGGGHASGQLGWSHFGLGDATDAEMRVIWPDGADSDWQGVEGYSFYIVERGKQARVWIPK